MIRQLMFDVKKQDLHQIGPFSIELESEKNSREKYIYGLRNEQFIQIFPEIQERRCRSRICYHPTSLRSRFSTSAIMHFKLMCVLGLLFFFNSVLAQRDQEEPTETLESFTVPSEDQAAPDRLCSNLRATYLNIVQEDFTGRESDITNEPTFNNESIIPDNLLADFEEFDASLSTGQRKSSLWYYYSRNQCNVYRKFTEIETATNIYGQSVWVIYPKKFYEAYCIDTRCRCKGKCVTQYGYQWAYVKRGCDYLWTLIRVRTGCCCHDVYRYYYY
ncbi:uncharacterized protein [Apostichopus japonicus]|uniref:uncharacterized protein n=1 Tax=Stichopus japonicus TaxID=307972 RepID=UPI003AB801BF